MIIFDSVMKKKVEFIPIRKNEVRIYLCGPTVYDNAHLGHARCAITFDLLRRILEANSYKVIFVKNFTDIDDKIILKSKEKNESIDSITSIYIEKYLQDMEALGVLSPTLAPRVTTNLESIFKMIEILLSKSKAYKTKNGDIYMRVEEDSKYGVLSSRANLDLQISRIGINESKKDSRDFALWKIFDPASNVAYPSPFGYGRPGWHIECSALIQKYLAYENEEYSIDIHAGGSDLLFPHHENEASQSRCANGVELSKYWMHNGLVNINGAKMSKSLGNSVFLEDILKIYNGEVLRYYLLNTHYRAKLDFSIDEMLGTKKRLDKLYRLKGRINKTYLDSNLDSNDGLDIEFRSKFLEALSDDMNVSLGLSLIDIMIAKYNDLLSHNPKDKKIHRQIFSNIIYINKILGIGELDSIEYFHLGVEEDLKKYIEEQIEIRARAKANKDYALSDKIRDELKAKNIFLLDTKDGVVWEYIWD